MGTHLKILGLVQGVGYRYNFQQRANALGLSGWVRNRVDGSVEAGLAGNPEAIKKLIEWAWRGPDGAQVKDIMMTEVDDGSIAPGKFEILASSSRSAT
ncbi:hypothetical protein BH11PSE11_BH11PSE11_34000 [soil metagenome]